MVSLIMTTSDHIRNIYIPNMWKGEVVMNNKKLKIFNPFEQEVIINNGKDVFMVTRCFIGSRSLNEIFEAILEKHDDLKDKAS